MQERIWIWRSSALFSACMPRTSGFYRSTVSFDVRRCWALYQENAEVQEASSLHMLQVAGGLDLQVGIGKVPGQGCLPVHVSGMLL